MVVVRRKEEDEEKCTLRMIERGSSSGRVRKR